MYGITPVVFHKNNYFKAQKINPQISRQECLSNTKNEVSFKAVNNILESLTARELKRQTWLKQIYKTNLPYIGKSALERFGLNENLTMTFLSGFNNVREILENARNNNILFEVVKYEIGNKTCRPLKYNVLEEVQTFLDPIIRKSLHINTNFPIVHPYNIGDSKLHREAGPFLYLYARAEEAKFLLTKGKVYEELYERFLRYPKMSDVVIFPRHSDAFKSHEKKLLPITNDDLAALQKNSKPWYESFRTQVEERVNDYIAKLLIFDPKTCCDASSAHKELGTQVRNVISLYEAVLKTIPDGFSPDCIHNTDAQVLLKYDIFKRLEIFNKKIGNKEEWLRFQQLQTEMKKLWPLEDKDGYNRYSSAELRDFGIFNNEILRKN